MLYPRILVPPVLDGGDQERLMQFLKALTTFGADGGPGYAVHGKDWDLLSFFLNVTFICGSLTPESGRVKSSVIS